MPDLAETARLAGAARRVNGGEAIDIPVGVGFCMYIRRACLDAVGLFRADLFAQGYGEENDFCLRARHLGWRHVAATGVFVAHIGGQSFGAAARHLPSAQRGPAGAAASRLRCADPGARPRPIRWRRHGGGWIWRGGAPRGGAAATRLS